MTKHWTSPVALQQAWPSLLLIIGQKATFLLIASSTPVGFNLMRWDSLWFRSVALLGYSAAGRDIPGAEKLSGLAFFPVYPLSARVLSNLTGIDIAVALIGLSWAGTLAAAWGIFAVGQHVAGRSAAVFLVGLWGAAPRSLVEVLAYSEGPFTALVAWCLYALLTTRFRTAAALGFIAGLTRGAALPMLGAILRMRSCRVCRPRRAKISFSVGCCPQRVAPSPSPRQRGSVSSRSGCLSPGELDGGTATPPSSGPGGRRWSGRG